MSKHTEALNEITKYQVELEYTMQGTDKWRNVMRTCKEDLEIADRLEQAEKKGIGITHRMACKYCCPTTVYESCAFVRRNMFCEKTNDFVKGYNQALADIRGTKPGE